MDDAMRYKFGIIFDIRPYMKRNDPDGVFADSDHTRLLTEIAAYITGEPTSSHGDDIEELLTTLIEEDILYYPVVLRRGPYVDVCKTLRHLCEELVEILSPTGFFTAHAFGRDKPKVRKVSRDAYAILTGPKMRNL